MECVDGLELHRSEYLRGNVRTVTIEVLKVHPDGAILLSGNQRQCEVRLVGNGHRQALGCLGRSVLIRQQRTEVSSERRRSYAGSQPSTDPLDPAPTRQRLRERTLVVVEAVKNVGGKIVCSGWKVNGREDPVGKPRANAVEKSIT